MSDDVLSGLRRATRKDFHNEASWTAYFAGMQRVGKGLEVLQQIKRDAAQYKKNAVLEVAQSLTKWPKLQVGLEERVLEIQALEVSWIWSMGDGNGVHEGYVLLLPDRLVRCDVAMCFPQGVGEFYPDWNSARESDETYLKYAEAALSAIYEELLPVHLRDE